MISQEMTDSKNRGNTATREMNPINPDATARCRIDPVSSWNYW
jgi:hypothetical protein